MRFDIITIFPEFFSGPLDHGIVRRAREAGIVNVHVQDLREFAHDRHRTVDDRPFGGGEGMVLKPEPIFEAVEKLLGPDAPTLPAKGAESVGHPQSNPTTAIVLLSASGRLFRQADARRLAQMQRIVLICGRYEGVDERVAEHLVTDELSVGDFVLSGGELPAAMVMDAVTRLLPGALGNEDSSVNESFAGAEDSNLKTAPEMNGDYAEGFGIDLGTPLMQLLMESAKRFRNSPGLLDCPHYTRPQEFRGWAVPEPLMSGNHAEIRRWRRKMALFKTMRNRPELLAGAVSEDDTRLIEELVREAQK